MCAKKIMIQATGFGTGAGKSLVTALLCRIIKEKGLRVAPFKPVNITGVTFPFPDKKEMGHSQFLQARAAKTEPDPRMNPLTIKPTGEGSFDIFLWGAIMKKNIWT